MRTNEERIAVLHRRTSQLMRERADRKFAAVCALSGAVCLGFLIGIASWISGIPESRFMDGPSDSMNASVFSDSASLTYIVIAVLAFLLGISITVFCFRMKKWLDEKDRGDFR